MHRITPKVARRGAATPSWDDRRVRAANPEPFRNPPGCERRLAAVEGQGTLCVLRGSNESGRPGSNRRRPAWEASVGKGECIRLRVDGLINRLREIQCSHETGARTAGGADARLPADAE